MSQSADQPHYKNKEWLREQLSQGRTYTDIGEECGVSRQGIAYWAKKHGLRKSTKKGEHNPDSKSYREGEWLQQQFLKGRTQNEIAEECGVHKDTIDKWAERNQVNKKAQHRRVEWLKYYLKRGYTYEEIANISVSTNSKQRVGESVNSFELESIYHRVQECLYGNHRYRKKIPDSRIEELFVDMRMTAKQIASETGLSKDGVYGRIKQIERGESDRPVGFKTTKPYDNDISRKRGYEICYADSKVFYHHRLLAVAEYGFEAVDGKEVHHKSLSWDNRPEAIELLTPEEHGRVEEWPDEREIHEVPRPPDPDQKEIDEFEPQDPLAF